MPISSNTSLAPRYVEPELRAEPYVDDAFAVERLARAAGVFSEAEIRIARELVEEALAKGAEGSGYHFLFADGPDGLEGFTCFGPINATVNRFELYWIVVHPEARRSGLGAYLLHASEEAARQLGGVRLFAESSMRADYAAARAFYVAEGFRQLADVPDWHDDNDGLAIFGKALL
jgi:GNAT superfamily N-acetyltransferase